MLPAAVVVATMRTAQVRKNVGGGGSGVPGLDNTSTLNVLTLIETIAFFIRRKSNMANLKKASCSPSFSMKTSVMSKGTTKPNQTICFVAINFPRTAIEAVVHQVKFSSVFIIQTPIILVLNVSLSFKVDVFNDSDDGDILFSLVVFAPVGTQCITLFSIRVITDPKPVTPSQNQLGL